jgi:hypothetical protein
VRKSIPETARRKLEKEICFAARRRGTEHAETCEGFEFEKVVSCSGRDPRRRTKLDFCSGEPFNDHHRSTTLGAAPEIVRVRSLLIGLKKSMRRCAAGTAVQTLFFKLPPHRPLRMRHCGVSHPTGRSFFWPRFPLLRIPLHSSCEGSG